MPSRRRSICTVAVLAFLLGGCGTRVDRTEIVAGAGGGPVELPPEVLAQLRAVAPPAAALAVPSTGSAPAPERARARERQSKAVAPAIPVARTTTAKASTTAAPAAATSTKPAAGCAKPGTPVAVGQIGNFSGVVGPITAGARTALAVWAQEVNARGGVACRPVVVYAVDDGGDASRAAAAVGRLVADKGIVALVGTVAILSFAGMVSGVEKAEIPVVGGDLAEFAWNENRWLYPQGSALANVVEERLRYALTLGNPKIATLYCIEAGACTEYAERLPAIARRAGVDLVSSTPVSLTQTEFVAQCQNAKNAGATALLIAMDGSAIGRVARSCAALGYTPLLISNGLVISDAQAADPAVCGNNLLTTNSNAPWTRRDTPGQREFLDAFARYAPGVAPAGMASVIWAAGRLFEAAIARLGAAARDGQLDTAAVLRGLGRIRNETLDGLSSPITFSAGQAAAPPVRCAYVELLTEEGWTTPIGSARLCGGRRTGA
ncbi:MAG: ABC transporter substrate-binding protein [Sporichthyaceae bacterium]